TAHPRYSDDVRFLGSGRQTLSKLGTDSTHRGSAPFFWDGVVCSNPVCRATNESAIFPAAVERPVESAAKRKSGCTIFSRFAALAKIWPSTTGGENARRPNTDATGAAPKKIAEQRSATRILHQWRSVQLRVAR